MSERVVADEAGYRAIPDEIIMAIGKLVVMSGNLEGLGHHVAEALGLDNERNQLKFSQLMRTVKARATDAGVPECSVAHGDSTMATELQSWTGRTVEGMDRRNSVLHSFFFFRMSSDRQWVAVREHIKPGEHHDVTLDDIDSVQVKLEALYDQGTRLRHNLLHPMGGGGFGNHYVQREVADDDQEFYVRARANYPACPWSQS